MDEGKFAEYKERFCDAISNDLNTSMAITIVYDLLKDDTLNDATKRALAEDFDRVLSLNLTTAKVENPAEDTEVDAELEAYILEKIKERKAAKKEKDFARSIGKDVEVKLFKAINKEKEFVGILKAYDEDTVTLEMEDETEMQFKRSDIARIRLAFFF